MRRTLVFAFLIAGCRSGFEADLADLRAEITRLEKEVPPEAPFWISEGPNAFAPHLEDFTSRIPDFIYNHLGRRLAQMKTEEIAGQVKGPFSPDAAFKDADALRGKFWKICGTIASLEPQPVGDRDLGFKQAFAGVIFMEGRPVLFHVVEKPEVAVIGHDVVEVNAVFVKILSYTARNGRKVDAPFLMGRRMGKYY